MSSTATNSEIRTNRNDRRRSVGHRSTERPTAAQVKAAQALLRRAEQGRGYGLDTPEIRRLASLQAGPA